MKFVLIPDSFKGTLSSEQICEIAKEKVEKHFPGAETACVPVADGGEGSVDAFITALGGSKVTVKVKNRGSPCRRNERKNRARKGYGASWRAGDL